LAAEQPAQREAYFVSGGDLLCSGDPKAQTAIGIMFSMGHGLDQDPVRAAQWYQKAADQGFAEAQVRLGKLYEDGNGVPQDKVKAAGWYEKAAAQGNTRVNYF